MKEIRPIVVIDCYTSGTSSSVLEDWQPIKNMGKLKEKYENKLGKNCFLFFETRHLNSFNSPQTRC